VFPIPSHIAGNQYFGAMFTPPHPFRSAPVALVGECSIPAIGPVMFGEPAGPWVGQSLERHRPESFRYRPKNTSTSRMLSSLASGFPPIMAPLPCRASGTRVMGAYESKL
jgi:hypothetical protein